MDDYDLNPAMTDRDVLKGLRRISKGVDRRRDYANLSWALSHVLGIVVVWKWFQTRVLVNCIDSLIQSVENRAMGKRSQEYLDFVSIFLGP